MTDSESSYNEDGTNFYDEEFEYEEESEEVVLEEELPHEEDEYTESDSYEYPWPCSSDDSWAQLSSDEAIQKIIEKLPTYSSESSGDEPMPQKPALDPYSDSDADSFIQHNDEKDYNPQVTATQMVEYDPDLYLKSIETYQLYTVSHSDSDPDESKDIDTDTPTNINTNLLRSSTPQTPMNETAIERSPSAESVSASSPIANSLLTHNKNMMYAKGQAQQDQNQPADVRVDAIDNVRKNSNSAAIQPLQSTIAVIPESPATEATELDYKYNIPEPVKPLYRGRDAPRRMTKTRIIIKKVASKRQPKRFKKNMKIIIKNHAQYEGIIGCIHFIGVIHDDKHKTAGIEILMSDILGENDGTHHNGTRYFSCPAQKGLFLPLTNVAKYVNREARAFTRALSNEFKKKSRARRRYQRNNAQMYGNVFDNLWKERIDLVKQGQYRIVRKAGPREFGRIEYFGGDDEYIHILNALNDPSRDWLAPRLRVPRKKKEPVQPKPGPRDIGRKDSYVGIEYEIGEEEEVRARKKAIIEARKKRDWAVARKKKLEEGRITRAENGNESKVKVKKKQVKNVKNKKKGKKVKKKSGSMDGDGDVKENGLSLKSMIGGKQGKKKTKSKSALPMKSKSKSKKDGKGNNGVAKKKLTKQKSKGCGATSTVK